MIDKHDMEREYWRSVKEFCRSCTLPVVAESTVAVGLEGTGVLFEINERYYFLTAAHVIEMIEKAPESVGVPGNRLGTKIYNFGDCETILPEKAVREANDVGMVHISNNKPLCSSLSENYQFLDLSNIGKFYRLQAISCYLDIRKYFKKTLCCAPTFWICFCSLLMSIRETLKLPAFSLIQTATSFWTTII